MAPISVSVLRDSLLFPTSPAEALRLVNGSPYPMVYVLFQWVFLCWFPGQESLQSDSLREWYPIPHSFSFPEHNLY